MTAAPNICRASIASRIVHMVGDGGGICGVYCGAVSDPISRRVYRSNRWRRVRDVVLERDDWVCQINGVKCSGRATCVDHVVPCRVSPDLAYELANLRASCFWCNNQRAVDDRVGRGDAHGRFARRRVW